MNKKSILYILLDLVFLAVFNTVFFVVGGTEHPASVWISYAFIHFAYIMVIATPILIRKSSSASVFGFSLYSLSATYFFAEFVLGLVFVLIASDSYKAALVVQVVLAGIYAILLISNLIANENTADSIERQESEVAYIKDAASRMKILIGKASDKKANKAIEKAYDLIHSSPSKSHRSVEVLEQDIKNVISELENAIANDNVEEILQLTKKIISTTEERNKRLKMF